MIPLRLIAEGWRFRTIWLVGAPRPIAYLISPRGRMIYFTDAPPAHLAEPSAN